MQLTLESTIAEDQERARRLGSVLWAKTKALLDQVSAQQATAAVHAEVAKQNSKASSAKLRDAVRAMAAQHVLQLTAWTGSRRSRAVWLKKQIASAIKREGQCYGLTEPPGWRLIDEELEKSLLD